MPIRMHATNMKRVEAISITVYTEYGCRGWLPLLMILELGL